MNTFSEKNSLFLSVVDDLVDGSLNFATEGKIVEIFDTGCDARTPGAAFKRAEKPDAAIQSNGLMQINNVPNVRKPFSLPLRQDKNQLAKNACPKGSDDKRQMIAGTCKSPKSSKLLTWDPRARNQVSVKSNEYELKTGLNSVVVTQKNAKSSEDSKRITVSLEKKKAISSLSRTRLVPNYGEKHRTVNLQSITSSLPKPTKVPEAGSTLCNIIERRAKTSSTKTPMNPAKSSQAKMSKVTSDASLNHGIKKYVNRAVDKDSLSNCSRQKIAEAHNQNFAKTSHGSRLPRSAGVPKFLPNGKPKSQPHAPIGTGDEATIKITSLMKIVGGTDHELQDKDVRHKTKKAIPIAIHEKRRDCPEGEIMANVNLNVSPSIMSQRKHGDNVEETLSTKTSELDNQDTIKLSLGKSKMTVSKMPLPIRSKNSLTGVKTMQNPGDLDRVKKVDRDPDNEEHKSFEKLSTEVEKTDKWRCQDLEKKLSASERPVTYTEKVSARPSAKCHNLVLREGEAKNTDISLRRKISKLRTPFRFQDNKHKEVLKCPSAVNSVPSKVKMEENYKSKMELNGKQPCASRILSEQLNDRLSRLSDRVQVSNSEVPLLSGVTENHCLVDHVEQSESKAEANSAYLSGVKTVAENDEEIELKTIFADTSTEAVRKPTLQSSVSLLGASKVKNTKLRKPPSYTSGAESQVPRPVATKRIPKKEITENIPAKTYPKKQEASTNRKASKNLVKKDVKTEAKPSTPPMEKSVENVPKNEPAPQMSVVTAPEEDKDEEVIPIMDPRSYNIHSFASHYRKRGNLDNTVPQETVNRGKLESWIDGHEQAYLRGRAIGLKVASMARAARENLKREYVRIGLKTLAPISPPDKSQEIVDIGLSIIEKVLAEKENKIHHSPSVRGDEVLNYNCFNKNIEMNGNGQWFT